MRRQREEINEKRCQSRCFCLCQRVSSNLPHTPTRLEQTGERAVSLSVSELDWPKLCLPLLYASHAHSVPVSLAAVKSFFYFYKRWTSALLEETSWWSDFSRHTIPYITPLERWIFLLNDVLSEKQKPHPVWSNPLCKIHKFSTYETQTRRRIQCIAQHVTIATIYAPHYIAN